MSDFLAQPVTAFQAQRLLAPITLEPEADVVDDLFPGQQTRLLKHQPGGLRRIEGRVRHDIEL